MSGPDSPDFDSDSDWDEKFKSTTSKKSNKGNTRSRKSSSGENDNEPQKKHLDSLHKRFGHTHFRPMQWKIIDSIITEQRDVCAIMATGYGKSLCYQYPSVFLKGVTLVISPLISLMEDQVLALKMSNIPACLLGSAQTNTSKVINEILSNEYRLVYATPEFCLGDYGMRVLKQMYDTLKIVLLAIDEAHCVSQWGHDFRTKYSHIWKLRNVLINVPILAVTATATNDVQNDIISLLKLKNPCILCSGFDRPNLYFEVVPRRTCDAFDNMKSYMTRDKDGLHFEGSTIIYCLTKKQTEEVQKNLSGHNIPCLVYHAGIPLATRRKTHEKFAKDQVKVIVATIAFGMGIDKPDVRMVIHYGTSKDLEGYYQEVGRAGRDGLPAKCILFYSNADFLTHDHLREQSSFGTEKSSAAQKKHKEKMSQLMRKYIDTLECRRHFILKYFGETIPEKSETKKDCCDNCTMQVMAGPKCYQKCEGLDEKGNFDIAEDAKLYLQTVELMQGKFGAGTYILMLRGSKSNKVFQKYQNHELHGKGKDRTDEWWKNIARIMERDGYLKKVYQKRHGQGAFGYSTIDLNYEGKKLLSQLMSNPDMEFKVVATKEMIKILNRKSRAKALQSKNWNDEVAESSTTCTQEKNNVLEEDPAETKYRMDLYKQMIAKRSDIAFEKECMPYMVASNTALMQMSRLQPKSLNELQGYAIDGFTEAKIETFGKMFVDFIRQYCSENYGVNCPDTSSSNTNLKLCSLNDNQDTGWISKRKNVDIDLKQTLHQFSFKERTNKTLDCDSDTKQVESTLKGTKELDETDSDIEFTFDDESSAMIQFGDVNATPVLHETSKSIASKLSEFNHVAKKQKLSEYKTTNFNQSLDEDGFDDELFGILDSLEKNTEAINKPKDKIFKYKPQMRQELKMDEQLGKTSVKEKSDSDSNKPVSIWDKKVKKKKLPSYFQS